MTLWAAWSVAGIALAIGLYAGWLSFRKQRINWGLVYAVGFLELVLVVQLVVGIIALTRTDRPVENVTFVGYLITDIIIPPAAVAWGFADTSRWGAGVVAVGMVTVAVLSARLMQIWNNPGV